MPRLIEPQEIPFSPLRTRILSFLHDQGGATLTQIAKFAGRANSTVLWHLYKLQKADLIGKSGTSYSIQAGSSLAASALTLGDEVARSLLTDLVRHPGSSVGESALRMGKPRSTVAVRVRGLASHRLVASRRIGVRNVLFPTALGRRSLGQLPRRRPTPPIPPNRKILR
ncbi:MAG: helix-turn-helix domain-containing protein [Thermoplasmatota archaeon]